MEGAERAEPAPSPWAHGEGEISQLIWERLPPLELVRARGVARVWRDGIDALPGGSMSGVQQNPRPSQGFPSLGEKRERRPLWGLR